MKTGALLLELCKGDVEGHEFHGNQYAARESANREKSKEHSDRGSFSNNMAHGQSAIIHAHRDAAFHYGRAANGYRIAGEHTRAGDHASAQREVREAQADEKAGDKHAARAERLRAKS